VATRLLSSFPCVAAQQHPFLFPGFSDPVFQPWRSLSFFFFAPPPPPTATPVPSVIKLTAGYGGDCGCKPFFFLDPHSVSTFAVFTSTAIDCFAMTPPSSKDGRSPPCFSLFSNDSRPHPLTLSRAGEAWVVLSGSTNLFFSSSSFSLATHAFFPFFMRFL